MSPNPPSIRLPGWYPSEAHPGYGEYWDGAEWTGRVRADMATEVDAASGHASSATTTPGIRLAPATWLGIALGGLWLLLSVASSGLPGLLVAGGSLALITSVYVLITGRRSWALIPSRRAGTLVLAGAIAVTLAGGGLSSRDNPPSGVGLTGSSEALPTEETSPPPVTTTRMVSETESVPFTSTTVDDPTLAAGTVQVTTAGVPGIRTVVYRVTFFDGVETDRVVSSDEITTPPVNEVVANGTYVAPPPPPAAFAPSGCDPNYGGACVPIDSDVDCAGGSGNGPSYVSGPVYVTGSDVYDLDRDGDGVACD